MFKELFEGAKISKALHKKIEKAIDGYATVYEVLDVSNGGSVRLASRVGRNPISDSEVEELNDEFAKDGIEFELGEFYYVNGSKKSMVPGIDYFFVEPVKPKKTKKLSKAEQEELERQQDAYANANVDKWHNDRDDRRQMR